MGAVSFISRIFGKQEQESEVDRPVSTREMLDFLREQNKANNELVRAVLETNASFAKTNQSYLDLFKPREIKSTTLEERELLKQESVKVSESDRSEWEPLPEELYKEFQPRREDENW